MQRRSRVRIFHGALGCAPAAAFGGGVSPLSPRRILLQESPLAVFQFHAGKRYWDRLTGSDSLALVRDAVAVYWRENKLGYVPRLDNAAVSHLMDRGVRSSARIAWLRLTRNFWMRIRFQVIFIS